MAMVMSRNGEAVVSAEATRLFDAFSLPVMVLDREQRFVYANAAYLAATHSQLDELLGRKVFDCFPDTPDRVAAVETKFRTTLDTGLTTQLDEQPFKLEMEDGSVEDLVWQAVQDPVLNPEGEVIGLVQRAEDVTVQVELRKRNEAIGYELNHRVKNIMAVVTSIARITGRHAETVPDFVRNFTNRLGAISRTNDQLARGDWRGLTVGDVLRSELSPYAETDPPRFRLNGPRVRLSLDATKDLSMVVHELATNAAKYGCLGEEAGSLDVRWTRRKTVLTIHWTESCPNGPALEPSDKTGFGTRLFDMLPYVEVEREFRPEGLALTIKVEGEQAFA